MTNLEIFVYLLTVAADKYDLKYGNEMLRTLFYLFHSFFSSNLSHMHVILYCKNLHFKYDNFEQLWEEVVTEH
jgi:hypothetical protein